MYTAILVLSSTVDHTVCTVLVQLGAYSRPSYHPSDNAALFAAGQQTASIRTTLSDMGYPQGSGFKVQGSGFQRGGAARCARGGKRGAHGAVRAAARRAVRRVQRAQRARCARRHGAAQRGGGEVRLGAHSGTVRNGGRTRARFIFFVTIG